MSTPKPPTFCTACGQQLPPNHMLETQPTPPHAAEPVHHPPVHTIVQAHTAAVLTPTDRKVEAMKKRAGSK